MYIFRWKENGIEVWPSKHKTEKEVWEWAIFWLRGAGETDDKKVEKELRESGEVVVWKP